MRTYTIIGAAMALTATPTMAAQPVKSCLTAAETTNLIAFLMPDVINTAGKSCAATLPPTSFFAQRRTELAGRYRAIAPAWSSVKSTIAKIGGMGADELKMMDAMPEDTMRTAMTVGLQVKLAEAIKPDHCVMINDVAQQLDPLPPKNTLRLMTLLFTAMSNDPKEQAKDDDFKICPTSTGS